MRATLYDGSRRVSVDTKRDTCLFTAARPVTPELGIAVWEKDLYMHQGKSGGISYYVHLCPTRKNGKRGGREKILPVSEIMAERFLRTRGLICNLFQKSDAIANLYNWGYGIAEEF